MPPAIIAAGITAAATIGAGAMSASAAGKASEARTASFERGIDVQEAQYAETSGNLAPWMQEGRMAGEKYSGLVMGQDSEAMYEGLRNYPGYQFAMEEGLGAVEQSQAGRGTFQSGQTMKDLTKYASGLASSNFENYMTRLQGLSGMGQQTAVQIGTFGANKAGAVSRGAAGAGEATASGYEDKAAAWGGVIEGVAGLGGQYIGGLSNTPPITPNPYSSEVLGGGVYS